MQILQTKTIIDRITDGQRFLCVHLVHPASDVYGAAMIPVEEAPVDVLDAIADDNWNHDLLERMRAEAQDEMVRRASAAREIVEALR